jgi:hypothetical protein
MLVPKWVYFLKHLEDFDHIPAILNEPIFQKGFEIAEMSHLSSDQYDVYLKSRLSYNENKAVKDTAFSDGKAEGETSKAIEIAKAMLVKGFDSASITEITLLTAQEIEALK